MTDWKALSHAYGEASGIPALIGELRANPSDTAWRDLWSCLCHQGTVYSASYASLQPLCELAKAQPPSDRLSPLIMIGAIIASDDLSGVDRRPVDAIQALIPDLQALADESMKVSGLASETFIYCLQAASAFAGDLFWGRHLNHLVDGEFPGTCPDCDHDLHLVIGAHGFFTTTQEWVRPRDANSRRNPISAAGEHDLSGSAAWLHSTATKCGQRQIALWIRYVFGTAACPACNEPFQVAEAIANAYPPRQNAEH
ncbi:hypothetical protein SAMN05519103_02710 [Rhizobiales bacterium GAS113]|jgi:hypothetical protein|nr:hypothetical protein SAMN05519103_02710 [Rhizobiales bacterium GAS113]